ncbi:MAG: Alpha-monoglucosyldiacylglycerol synthase [Chlamydiae bacterium]|nr:Alpha-monoglucosyldiacylglycerol synthase [Chlamydiota bacterium]
MLNFTQIVTFSHFCFYCHMKIGIETTCLSQTIRGVGTYTLTLIESLKAQQQEILCYDHSIRLRLPFASSITSLFRSRCYEKVGLMHFPDPKILYGRRPNTPIVLTIHDIMPVLFPQFFPTKSRLMMERFLPRYLRDADAITCPSIQTKEDLVKTFQIPSEKIHVIPLALLPQKRIIQEEKESFLLYIGSFEPRKNLPGILEAFAKVRKWGFPHKLILVGKEEGKNRIPHALIAKLGLREHIELKGYVTEEEKCALLQKAALLLWPSFYEGFGLPLLEAMASGTPIVTTNGSAMCEVVQDAAILIDPNNSDAIASAVVEVVSSPEKTKTLMEKGLKRAADFSLENFGKRHVELYSSLVNRL